MNLFQKIKYSQNWNIGFCEQTPEELICTKSLNKIQWMKHDYKDRWFADPFIYKVTEDRIVVFVEECPLEHPKGILCELVLDRKTKRLLERHVLLESDTHLSYPAIIEHNEKTYVYPENGASGKLSIYEYDAENHRLVNPICILDEAVADATILEREGRFIMVATKYPDTQENAFLYHSSNLYGPFSADSKEPCQISRNCSRPGGNWIRMENKLYRPAQDCGERYGSALSLVEIIIDEKPYREKLIVYIKPSSYKYNLGIHTINHKDGLCVIDGFGYYYPTAGRFYYSKLSRGIISMLHRQSKK